MSVMARTTEVSARNGLDVDEVLVHSLCKDWWANSTYAQADLEGSRYGTMESMK